MKRTECAEGEASKRFFLNQDFIIFESVFFNVMKTSYLLQLISVGASLERFGEK